MKKNNHKKTLIVIDMQNDFINGSLGTKEAENIVPNVKRKIEQYLSNSDEIIFTRDTHYQNYLETNEGIHLPVPHCISGTNGWEIPDDIDVPECEHVNKESFGWNNWNIRYNSNGKPVSRSFEEIEIVGVCTDICVISNALILKAMYPEIRISVDASCCAGVTPEKHRSALEVMKSCQIDIINE